MSSTGRSESTNNFFNGWLPITTRLYSFVTKYEATLLEVYERESVEDFKSEHKYRQVGPHQALLKDVVNIYTRIILYKLQDRFDQVVRFIAIERPVEGNVRQLTVKSHSGHTDSFELEIDLEKLTGNCVCWTPMLSPPKGFLEIRHSQNTKGFHYDKVNDWCKHVFKVV
ncbi:hypothetical protein GIB67_012012 [Kingdonia uniflora]|uniref:Protein FAR1-RELATED SEQUENCE n=1 Tax=Kingdonia uniflora TaxID=39325 RepID=A0A7J7M051_9MAGN|nr:hypothetical protein GIB67_012012 [Kingdonia uniflora]